MVRWHSGCKDLVVTQLSNCSKGATVTGTLMRHLFGTRTLAALEKAMEGTLLRTRVCMNNVANVDTPGFKRQVVTFEDQLARALRSSGGIEGRVEHPRHIPIRSTASIANVRPLVHTDLRSSFRADGNNVDIDQEMVALATAAGQNVRLTELLSRSLRDLNTVIRERV